MRRRTKDISKAVNIKHYGVHTIQVPGVDVSEQMLNGVYFFWSFGLLCN